MRQVSKRELSVYRWYQHRLDDNFVRRGLDPEPIAEVSGGAPIDTGHYITVMQAAKKIGLSRQRTYVLIRQGRLDAYLVAGRWLVNEENLKIKPPQGRRNDNA